MTPPSTAAARARPRRREATAPAVPRRVSGPARPERAPLRRPRVVAAARVAAPATTVPGIALPRRQPAARPARRAPIAPGRLLGALAALPDARLLDRLIRGRLWIGLVAFALIGIVAMQLMLLKLNTGIGHAIEHEQLLQRQNASLEIAVSNEAAPDRVQLQAQRLGMTPAAPGAIQYLSGSGHALTSADVRALATLVSSSSSSSSTGAGATTAASAPGTGATAGSASGTTAAGVATSPTGAGPPSTATGTSTAGTGAGATATGTSGTSGGAGTYGTAAGGAGAPGGASQTVATGSGGATSASGTTSAAAGTGGGVAASGSPTGG